MSAEARALLLIGTMGSGKTTVMLEVGRLLSERGEPHALVHLRTARYTLTVTRPGSHTARGTIAFTPTTTAEGSVL